MPNGEMREEVSGQPEKGKGGKERGREAEEEEQKWVTTRDPVGFPPMFRRNFFIFPANWIKDLEQSPSISWSIGVVLEVELKTPKSRVLHGFDGIGAFLGRIGLGHRRRSS
ncbi:unnamed protein product [Malus baccata var. baccata]